MKVQIFKIYSIDLVRKCPEALFVFGDNEKRWGKGGQAIIRDEVNTFGIATKKSPDKFWSDDEYIDNINVIKSDMLLLQKKMQNYNVIAFPQGGLGTGLARLHIVAPLTFMYLTRELLEAYGFNNMNSLISRV